MIFNKHQNTMKTEAQLNAEILAATVKIKEYAPELEKQINSLVEVKRDSEAEVELRASSIYVIAKLTEEINKRRPGMEPLLQPQVDFRFWKTYHATHWPHHLTKTVMY